MSKISEKTGFAVHSRVSSKKLVFVGFFFNKLFASIVSKSVYNPVISTAQIIDGSIVVTEKV